MRRYSTRLSIQICDLEPLKSELQLTHIWLLSQQIKQGILSIGKSEFKKPTEKDVQTKIPTNTQKTEKMKKKKSVL